MRRTYSSCMLLKLFSRMPFLEWYMRRMPLYTVRKRAGFPPRLTPLATLLALMTLEGRWLGLPSALQRIPAQHANVHTK